MGMAIKLMMAKRTANELEHGNVVNLGYGLPQQVVNYLPEGKRVFVHTENGIIGAGPMAEKGKEDPDLVDAGCKPITAVPGTSYCDGADSFGLIRSGNVDVAVLGALQVAQNGDLANWMTLDGTIPGMGGAMELAEKAKKVIVLTTHQTKTGESKLMKKCTYPLTAKSCVSLIITDLCVMEIKNGSFLLKELFDGHTIEEVIEKTDAEVIVNDDVKVVTESSLM